MNISGLALPTPLAQPASFKDGLASRRSPSDSVGTRWPSLPSRVRLPYRKLRLPFGHTAVPAKHPFAVEVALWTNYILAAPFAEPRFTASETPPEDFVAELGRYLCEHHLLAVTT